MRISLAALVLLGVAVAAITTITASAQTQCAPGEYVYNVSGQYYCIPAIHNTSLPWASVSAYYVNTTTVNITVVCAESTGCSVELALFNATGGNMIGNWSLTMDGGETRTIQVNVGANIPLVLHVNVNGYDAPVSAIPPYMEAADVTSLTSDPRLGILYTVFLLAPPLGLLMRGSGREAGIALIATSTFYPIVLTALGMPQVYSMMFAGLVFVAGLLLAAVWQE